MTRFASILLASALAYGCTETVAACPDPMEVRDADGNCGPAGDTDGGTDAGGEDGGGDADTDVCGGCATGLLCRTSDEVCVECLGGGDCGTGMCDEGPGACIECTSSSQCSDPALPACSSGSCTADCTGTICEENHSSAPACDATSGECVACTPATETTHCSDFSCNPTTLECTTTERGTLLGCQDCVSDSECADFTFGAGSTSPMRCVPGDWDTPARSTGMHCMVDLDALTIAGQSFCPDGFAQHRELTSVGDVTATYCHPLPQTTCQAISSLRSRSGGDCTTTTVDDACGIMGEADALCPDTRCTVFCRAAASSEDCLQGTCISGACI